MWTAGSSNGRLPCRRAQRRRSFRRTAARRSSAALATTECRRVRFYANHWVDLGTVPTEKEAHPRILQPVVYLTRSKEREGRAPSRPGVACRTARGDTRPPVRDVPGEGRASSRPAVGCRVSPVVREAYPRGERTRQRAPLPITPCSPWLRVCMIRGCAPIAQSRTTTLTFATKCSRLSVLFCGDALHCQSDEATVADIDEFIRNHQP